MKRTLLYSALLLALLSCSKEQNKVLASGEFNLSLCAELPEMSVPDNGISSNETKASTQYTVRIKWVAGDNLSVINLTTGKILGGHLKANSSGNITTFSGTLSGTVRNGDMIAYLYPSQDNTTEEVFSSVNIDMSTQAGTTGGVPLCVYCTSTANSDSFNNESLVFSYLMSYMMIGLSDIPSSALIKTLTLTNVTSSFDLSINSANNGLTVTPHLGDIVLSPNQAASTAGVKTVYAAIPGSETATRIAILETGSQTFSTAFTSAKLNNGYAYNTNVSGFLVDDLVIEDPALREYCITHFDANGDGKLTMVEIAGVTAFPNQEQYPLPSGIRRFNELQYFYSLSELPSFKNQRQLESVIIPQQITSIPDETFYGCTNLTKVILLPVVPPSLGNNVFYGLNGNLVLVVPDEALQDYQEADGWRDFFNNLHPGSSQDGSVFNIETEDEDSMEDNRIDFNV